MMALNCTNIESTAQLYGEVAEVARSQNLECRIASVEETAKICERNLAGVFPLSCSSSALLQTAGNQELFPVMVPYPENLVGFNHFYCLNNFVYYEKGSLVIAQIELQDLRGLVDLSDSRIQGAYNSGEFFKDIWSKILAKKLISAAGVKIPEGVTIRSADAFCSFKPQGDFVVKPYNGANGQGVRLFSPERMDQALDHARSLLLKNDDQVLLESRVEPYPLSLSGTRSDWNIRAILALGKEPHWMGGVIRAKPYGFEPVNVKQGASVYSYSDVINKIDPLLDLSIRTAALKIGAQIIRYKQMNGQSSYGWVGIDMMVNPDLQVYCWEFNPCSTGGIIDMFAHGALDSSGVFVEVERMYKDARAALEYFLSFNMMGRSPDSSFSYLKKKEPKIINSHLIINREIDQNNLRGSSILSFMDGYMIKKE